MKKKLVTLVMVSALATSLVACGSNSNNTNTNADSNKVNVENDSTKNDTESSTVEQSKDIETKENEAEKENISVAKENELVVYIAGKEVKLDQTWDEFQKMVEDYGWSLTDDRSNDWPHYDEDEKEWDYYGSGYVQTSIGKVEFSFMDNEDMTGAVLREIRFVFNYITENNYSVCGINMTTSFDAIEKELEFLSETEAGRKYHIDDWVTVFVTNPYEGKSTVSIKREQFHMRNK